MKAQLIRGKHDIRVRVEDGDKIEVVSLKDYNKRIPVPIVPPGSWEA